MGRRALIELLHIVAGMVMTALFAWLASWAVPLATGDIWATAWFAMLVVAFLGIRPMRLAMAADRADRDGTLAEPAEL